MRRTGEILGEQPFTSEDMADLLGVALPTLTAKCRRPRGGYLAISCGISPKTPGKRRV